MNSSHVCVVCGYVHEENSDIAWHDLPDNYECPECGVGKAEFEEV